MSDLELSIVCTIFATLVGVAGGGLITWKVAKRYYKRAGDELQGVAHNLTRSLTTIAVFLQEEEDGSMQISYDKDKEALVATFHHVSGGLAEFGGGATTS